MKYWMVICFILVFAATADAQHLLYSSDDEIEINYSDKYGIHFVHTISKGHTLYGLSRIFNVPVSRIRLFNQMPDGQTIQPGQLLRIPFDDKLLYKGVSIAEFPDATFLPVYYIIKPKETLYRVSKVYFDQEASVILERNGLANNQLQIGQKLLMGWIPIDDKITIASDQQVESAHHDGIIDNHELVDTSTLVLSDTLLSVNELERDTVIAEEVIEPTAEETGLAYWNRNSSDKDNLFVMHPTARINSLIEIYNPQLNRRTFAKVIARIPADAYPSNVDIVVSPRVAFTLGALNSEFRVRMKYFE